MWRVWEMISAIFSSPLALATLLIIGPVVAILTYFIIRVLLTSDF